MTALLLLSLSLAQSYYFADSAVYDPVEKVLRQNMYLLVGDDGRTVALGFNSMPVPENAIRIEKALILPHYADFYLLLQERGLGLDEDLDPDHQRRIGETCRLLGLDQFRDPVFPAQGVSPLLNRFSIHAQRGYIDVVGGPGAAFGMVLDTEAPLATQLERLPKTGPVTLWWTSRGRSTPVRWPDHRDWLTQFLQAVHERGQKAGAFIEGAKQTDLSALEGLALDFVEGMPDELEAMTVSNFPGMVWVPLLALNDKRYCASALDGRLEAIGQTRLYDQITLQRAQDMSRQAQAAMIERCKVWKRRRPEVFEVAENWIAEGGLLALGSAGGHPFSFSAELKPEIEAWQALGMGPMQVLENVFATTPALLGGVKPFLRVGKPAHFIVYRQADGLERLGTRVDINFFNGAVWETSFLAD